MLMDLDTALELSFIYLLLGLAFAAGLSFRITLSKRVRIELTQLPSGWWKAEEMHSKVSIVAENADLALLKVVGESPLVKITTKA